MAVRSLTLICALFALALAGCGNKHAVVTLAETEGIYIDVGELDYQIQNSRVLNPNIDPDRQYLTGLPEDHAAPKEDETYFVVFMRVQNQTDEAHTSADEFEIVDTQENRYTPIELDPAENPFVYQSGEVAPHSVYPTGESLTAEGPTQGALLLFKLPYSTLQNRPLEFKITPLGSIGEEGIIDIDV
jgi:hypothetical protein